MGASDIALCGSSGSSGSEATAQLLDTIFAGNAPGNVFTAGDNAYNSGAASEFADCYDPTWGRQKARTEPAPGNHEYVTANASVYFGYFSAPAANSEIRNGDTYGVLKMTLSPTSFDWEFVPVAGETFSDSGSQACH